MSNTLLRVYPSDLKIPFGLKRQNSGIMELTNKTDQHVAFKVKTTNPRKYSVRPTSGVVLPRGSSGITVSMQAPREIPADYHCKDKFLIQSVVVEEGTASKDIHSGMFSKEPGKVVEEFKLRVVYIPANPPSPVPEEEEEDIDSLDSDVDYELKMPSTSYSASRLGYTSGSQASHNNEAVSLTEAVLRKYLDENQKLQQALDLKKRRPSSVRGFSTLSVLLVFAFSVFAGYFMTQSNV